MAKKKQEIQLLREIESQEEWEDIMGKEGLWVVDVYQEWSGPCDAMVSNFRRIKNELGDSLLHFAMAKADNIESLEKYRGSCEPCFLYFAAGTLVSFVHGANAPLILRTLTEQLAQEHKVVDGTAERKEVKDPFVANREAAEEAQKDEDEEEDETDEKKFHYNGELVMYGDELTPAQGYEEVEEGFTVAIIKPNVVEEGKVDEILAEMKAKGIEVLAQEERQLTEEEAREFYSHLKDEEYFNDLVSFMASGPSHMLVLTKGQEDDSIIKDWRDMLGPPTVEDAKETAPDCLRARYGQAGLMNALHGSDSKETAARELAFFFPSMSTPTLHKKKKEVQRTLALIRPDAFAKNRDAILDRIKEAGFQIALQKEVVLTKEQAEEFYKEHAGQHYYEELTNRMSSGPLLALGLAREDAVVTWREMLGPTDVQEAKETAPDSLRAQFANEDDHINELHGSESVKVASQELNFFFPMEQTVAMIKPDAISTQDAIIDKIHEAGFRIAARKETTITREIAESFYEDQKDKEYFNDLVEHMTSGPTMFMVLSREDAVEGWRQEIGPTDPAKAKEEAPDSLRAQFGSDILKNAVHGASSQEEARRKIETVFGTLEFEADDQIKKEQEEEAISGSPVPQAADVGPEYRDRVPAEQEQAEQPQAEQQEEGAKAEEQQQAEQPTKGQAEGEGQSEEKPAEGEGEAAEQTEKAEGEAEEKPSEQTEDSEKKEDESDDHKTGQVDEKPSEPKADSPRAGSPRADSPRAGSPKKDEDTGRDPEVESSHSGIDLEAGQAAQQKAAEEEKDQAEAPAQQDKAADDTPAGDKAEEATEQAQAKTEDQKEDTPAAAEAQDTKAEDKKEDSPAAEDKDTKAEEQKEGQAEGQKEEATKAEQKEDTAQEKKES